DTQESGCIHGLGRDWTKRGNVVQLNFLHDSGGYGRNAETEAWRSPFDTWGVYLDEWLSGVKVHGNVIAHTYFGGVGIHGGRDNVIENNILVDGSVEQVRLESMPR